MAIPLAALSPSPVSAPNKTCSSSPPPHSPHPAAKPRETRDAAIDAVKRWLYRLRCCESCRGVREGLLDCLLRGRCAG
ncbi:hypothetical protein VPH35_026865 [Triticum aestivum]